MAFAQVMIFSLAAAFLFALPIAATTTTALPQTQGLPCGDFDKQVCEGQPDGSFHENKADCGSPFCKTTYVFCSNSNPNVKNCNATMVWSQASKACIPKTAAPGQCPDTCGIINATLCIGVVDGTSVRNPIDCNSNLESTFVYCKGQQPIITVCPQNTTWNTAVSSCATPAGTAVKVNPFENIPETNGTLPNATAPAPDSNDLSDLVTPELTKDPEVQAPAPAPSGSIKDGKDDSDEDEESDDEGALAPGPAVSADAPAVSIPSEDKWSNITLLVSGKNLEDLTDLVLEEAIVQLVKLPVQVDDNNKYGVSLQLALNDFENAKDLSDEVTQDEVSSGVEWLVQQSFGDLINRVDVNVEPSADLSTASAKTSATADVALQLSESEASSALDIIDGISHFDVTQSQVWAIAANSTKDLSQLMYEYLQKESLSVNSYLMTSTITVHHMYGDEGNRMIKEVVDSGDLGTKLSELLGTDVDVEVLEVDGVDVSNSPAPAPSQPDVTAQQNSAISLAATLTTFAATVFTALFLLW